MMTLVVVSEDAHAHWVRSCVHADAGFRVIWHGADARAASAVAQVLLPDIAVLDLTVVGDADAVTLVRGLRASAPGIGFVLYAPAGRALSPDLAVPLAVHGDVRLAWRGDAVGLMRAVRALAPAEPGPS